MAQRIETWFARHQRPLPWRDGYDPYRVWVSEVMLQQTRVEVVLPYFARFLARFPDVHALAAASDDDVTAAWSGLGYYRRARMLRDGARAVVERFGGAIPRTIHDLRTIPGIGRYTAGAIASIAFEERAPIVDGNVARVVARLFASNGDPWPLAEELVNASASPRALNQGLMELGALLCTPRNPSCLICPARTECRAANGGRVDEFPRAKPRKATRALRIPLYIVTDRRGRVLMRREPGALLTGMWHLPHGDSSLLGDSLVLDPIEPLGIVRHTITNRRIEFVVSTAAVTRKPRGYEWIALDAMDSLPIPSYVRKALDRVSPRIQ
ncbi:MAG TPA: A/G-specific adenine glycosylase [Thermoanaerobaculia bacterium]|nr:A/G-specific adenine glycosylase [Thermoanaerobaculia bacterium]